MYIPVVPARGGAEVALGLYYKAFLIYRTCMRHAGPCVRVFCPRTRPARDPDAMQR